MNHQHIQSPDGLPGGSSNSGATFRIYADLFLKAGGVEEAEKLRDQMIWLACLAQKERYAFPMLQYGKWGKTAASYCSEYVQADNLSSQLSSRPICEGRSAVEDAARWLSNSLHKQVAGTMPCLMRLVDQTEGRLFRLAAMGLTAFDALRETSLCFNGSTIPSPLDLLAEARRATRSLSLEATVVSRVHGDFHLGNLLLSETQPLRWWLIDPRGRFAGGTEYFDNYYDWGKLFHDLYGLYNLAVQGEIVATQSSSCSFEVQVLNDGVGRKKYALVRQSMLHLLDELEHTRGGLQARKLLLYVGLLTLGAVPFHKQHGARAVVLLCAGSIALHQGISMSESECRGLLGGDFLSSLL